MFDDRVFEDVSRLSLFNVDDAFRVLSRPGGLQKLADATSIQLRVLRSGVSFCGLRPAEIDVHQCEVILTHCADLGIYPRSEAVAEQVVADLWDEYRRSVEPTLFHWLRHVR
jgi:hypothetical protein